MSKTYSTPIINSKAAQVHLAKIKADHADYLITLQQHKDRIANDKIINEQKAQEQAQMKQDRMMQEHQQKMEIQKQQFEQGKILGDQEIKKQDLAIKMKALSSNE